MILTQLMEVPHFSMWEDVTTDEFEIASELNFPSYISFWSALNYYSFSDNTPKKIFVATRKQSRDIGNFKFVTISKDKFFGHLSIGKIVIANEEKPIIDSLLFSKYSGRIKEIEKSLKNAINEISLKKLINYAIKTKSKVIARRLGYLLELLNVRDSKKLEKDIEKAKREIEKYLSKDFKIKKIKNLYGERGVSKKVVEVLDK